MVEGLILLLELTAQEQITKVITTSLSGAGCRLVTVKEIGLSHS